MKNIVLFGASSEGEKMAKFLRYEYNILYFVDNNKAKQGMFVKIGDKYIEVKSPSVLLNEDKNTKVIVTAAKKSGEEIMLWLKEMNINNCIHMNNIFDLYNKECKHAVFLKEYIEREALNKDDKNKNEEIWNMWLNHYIPRTKNVVDKYKTDYKKVLDFGCGCGTNLFYYLLLGYDAYGIDIDMDKKKFIDLKIDELNYPKEWKERIYNCYGEELVFDDESFDVITCYQVLEHVSDYKSCILEMLRVLRKSGVIYMTLPDYKNTFEEHYLIDFGKPLYGHKAEFKDFLIRGGVKNVDFVDGLNFLTKSDINEVLFDYEKTTNNKIEIIDLNTKFKIHYIVRKI